MPKPIVDRAYRFAVTARTVAAIFGSYALAAVVALWLERLLPMDARSATLTANMTFFVVYACAVVWVFATASVKRAWLGLLVPTVILGGGFWLSGGQL